MINNADEYASSVVMGIAELAEMLGTSKSSLRFYEKEGLIKPERAEESGYRRYSLHALVELTDIIMYRNIGVPVKDVRHLLDAPVEETEHALDDAEDELLTQIEEAQKTLRLISARRRIIRRYHETMKAGAHLVERPAIDELYAYDLEDRDFFRAYLQTPQEARFSVLFPNAADPAQGYLNGTAVPIPASESEPAWTYASDSGPWMECLLETGYDLPDENNLSEYVEKLRALGFEPGRAVAEYLTFGAGEDGIRHDYYRCWIETL